MLKKLIFSDFQKINFLFLGTGHQHLQFKIMMSEKESVTSHVHEMRLWLAKTTSAHPGEILITALNIKPALVTVTFMMKDIHANTFLKYVKTNDGQNDVVRKRVKTLYKIRNVGGIGNYKENHLNIYVYILLLR